MIRYIFQWKLSNIHDGFGRRCFVISRDLKYWNSMYRKNDRISNHYESDYIFNQYHSGKIHIHYE